MSKVLRVAETASRPSHDAASALETVRSPVFLFLCLVAVVPLAIQALDGIESVSAAGSSIGR